MSIMAIPKFERFFRAAASLDVDKNDLKRYSEFANQKLYDLLVRGEANAKANGREFIEPWDLPITKGLQERVHEFENLDEEIELAPILEQLAKLPPLSRDTSPETEERIPSMVGGISIGLARSFKIIDPDLENPQTEHWERAFQLFSLLL